MQKFILPSLRLVIRASIKERRSNLAKNRSAIKPNLTDLRLNVKSKMHHVAVLNDVVFAF